MSADWIMSDAGPVPVPMPASHDPLGYSARIGVHPVDVAGERLRPVILPPLSPGALSVHPTSVLRIIGWDVRPLCHWTTWTELYLDDVDFDDPAFDGLELLDEEGHPLDASAEEGGQS